MQSTSHRLQIAGSKTSADLLGVTPFPIFVRVIAQNGAPTLSSHSVRPAMTSLSALLR